MNYPVKLDQNRLNIFHEGRKRRVFVGELFYNQHKDRYELKYDKKYARSKNAISVGAELDLFKLHHLSEKGKLFPSFIDRIPDKANPAYKDYCIAQGISPNENNMIVLLSSIGRRGPSSFVFEPVYYTEFTIDDVKKLRKKLQITQYDFANAFGINKGTLQKLETGLSHDPNTLKYLEILLNFPQVALWQLKQTGDNVHADVLVKLVNYFE